MPLTAPPREALIAACPLFRGLDADGMAAVAEAAVEVEFAADRTIARQGEIGTGQFIVAEGAVRVSPSRLPPHLASRRTMVGVPAGDAARSPRRREPAHPTCDH